MSRALVSGVGSGLSCGVTTGDWKGSMMDGMRNSVASYLGGKAGFESTAMNNATNMVLRKLMGSDEKMSWDTVAQNDAIGAAVGGYLNEALMSNDLKKARDAQAKADVEKRRQDSGKADSMDNRDLALFGIFRSLKDDFSGMLQDAGNVADDVKQGWNDIQSGAAWEGFKGAAASAWNGITDLASSVVKSVGNFAQRTGNLFTEGSFATDLEIRDAHQRQELRGLVGLNGGDVPIGTSYMQKFRETEEKMKGGGIYEGANSKAVEDIMEKISDGKPVDASDLQKLTATMLQKSTLSKEVLESILNDKEAFEQLAGKTFDFGENGTVKLDLNNPESIKAYAENISKVYCVAASLYGQMVVGGIDGTPGSFGEFTKQLLKKDLINPNKPARQINSTQDIIDAFAGKGKYQVVGCGTDAGGGYFKDEFGNSTKGINPADTLNNLKDAAKNNQDINYFNVRIDNPHSMNLYNNSGRLSIFDTSTRGFGASFTKSVTRINISSWYYIKRANRS
jgi:hypothetical protein